MSHTLKYTSRLASKRILVIGGTSGIGYCVAEAALEYGSHLVLSSSNPTKLDMAVTRLRETYPSQTKSQTITTHACDMSNTGTLDSNIEQLLRAATAGGTKKLDHVVFTAGDSLKIPALSELTPSDIQAAGTVRFTAPLMLAKHLPRYMELSPTSSLTLTGGIRSHKPAPGWAMMSGWGCAVEGLVRGLALDLKSLRVNMVAPGPVHTELFSSIPPERLPAVLDKFRAQSTTGTVGSPGDLAMSYIYLMQDQFASGSIVESNGGARLV